MHRQGCCQILGEIPVVSMVVIDAGGKAYAYGKERMNVEMNEGKVESKAGIDELAFARSFEQTLAAVNSNVDIKRCYLL